MPKRNEVFITVAIPRELYKRLKEYNRLYPNQKLKGFISCAIMDRLDVLYPAEAAPSQPTTKRM